MQYLNIALSLALATGALANPLLKKDTCSTDSCLAAVTGKGALGDDKLRADHCKSYLATTVTPEAVTVTSTITGVETTTAGWDHWKREKVTVCPNEVPNYASACDRSHYSSACSCYGFSGDSTTTLTRETVTKTVYVHPGPSTCSAAFTKTVTVSVSSTSAAATCLSQSQVDYFVESFTNFLQVTDRSTGLNTTLANEVLTSDFIDISDSINYMAGIPLGSITFPNRAAFIAGQGSQFPVSVTSKKTFVGCKFFAWQYVLTTGPVQGPNLPVQGLNVFTVTDDLSQLKSNYVEFNNGAWIQNIGNPARLCGASSSAKASTTTTTVAAPSTTKAVTTTTSSHP